MARRVTTVSRRHSDFVKKVADTIMDAGFEVQINFNRVFDLSFRAANGDRIAVECGLRADPFSSEKQIQAWESNLRKPRPQIDELLVVNPTFPTRIRDLLDAYDGIEMVPYGQLPIWLERYKLPPKPKRPSRSTRIVSTVRANRDQIIITTEALALQIDDKIAKLKDENPNSPEAISARDSAISDYEALKAQVEDLKKAVAKLNASAKSKEQAAKAATSFGDGFQDWWNKQHVNFLDKAAGWGLVLSAVGVCSLIGVGPLVTATVAAVVGRKSVSKALKGFAKGNA